MTTRSCLGNRLNICEYGTTASHSQTRAFLTAWFSPLVTTKEKAPLGATQLLSFRAGHQSTGDRLLLQCLKHGKQILVIHFACGISVDNLTHEAWSFLHVWLAVYI